MSKQTDGKRPLRLEDEKKTFGEGLSFAAAEAYRLLRTNVLFALPFASLSEGQTCRVIGITSSLSGEGKSTTALNMACVLAESGRKILLVEADMRLPTISKRLGLEKKEGLSNLLAGLCEAEKVLQPSGLQEQLWIVGSGETPPNPSELLGSGRMRDAINRYAAEFDFIILDLPPVNEVSDALVVSRLTHGMVMVVRQGYATRSSVSAAMRQLGYVDAKVLGFVMTHANIQTGKYKSYYKGKYGYSYAGAGKAKESKTKKGKTQ
ncbi:MAG: CpsD/CapB family tyrosine-protein kinase [Clostridiales bacterium]|nr:CpsD/CapB family tyrosine-protein kinase [Clostridiales bacterium]